MEDKSLRGSCSVIPCSVIPFVLTHCVLVVAQDIQWLISSLMSKGDHFAFVWLQTKEVPTKRAEAQHLAETAVVQHILKPCKKRSCSIHCIVA